MRTCNIARHERLCIAPRTLERLYEIGNVDVTADGCWEWRGRLSHGYGMVGQYKAARLVLEVDGEMPGAWHALHLCDNKACVRRSHLYAGTHSDNMRDVYTRGLVDKEARNAAVSASMKKFFADNPDRADEYRRRARTANTGRTHSAETKEKMRQAHLGKTKSAETRQRMSDARKARVHKNPDVI